MTTFSAIVEAKTREPLRCIEIPLADYADEWPDKPVEPTRIGLRLIAEAEMQTARAQAAKKAVDMCSENEDRIAVFNDALMTWAVAVGTCDPADVTKTWLFAAVDNLPLALTSRGIQRIWEQIERFHIEASPLYPEATDAQLHELAGRLVSGLWAENLTPAGERRARKLLAFVLSEGLPE